MKRTLIMIFCLIMLFVAYGLIGREYMNRHEGRNKISSEITSTTQQLEKMPPPPLNLEARLAAAQATLTAIQSTSTDRPNSSQVINRILRLADDCQVQTIPLTTRPWSYEKSDKGYYSVFRLTMTVAGGFSQLVNFVSRLESGDFGTLVVENLGVTNIPRPGIEASPETALITASIDVAIYAASPDSN